MIVKVSALLAIINIKCIIYELLLIKCFSFNSITFDSDLCDLFISHGSGGFETCVPIIKKLKVVKSR